jgi:SAM-dependent methyltransferase
MHNNKCLLFLALFAGCLPYFPVSCTNLELEEARELRSEIVIDGAPVDLVIQPNETPVTAVSQFCRDWKMTNSDCQVLYESIYSKWRFRQIQRFAGTSNRVRAQYEAYPYPPRNPWKFGAGEEEAGEYPGGLAEISHWIFNGTLLHELKDGGLHFRVLIAGCGTGDQAVQMAKDLALFQPVAGYTIVCLDLSSASLDVAKERLRVRGLDEHVEIIRGSLLDYDLSRWAPFHYIGCVGVLHHLPNPLHGLKTLHKWLHPRGGIGLRVYGTLGRAGIYDIQSSMRDIMATKMEDDLEGPSEADHRNGGGQQIRLLLHLLQVLPPSNPLYRQDKLSASKQPPVRDIGQETELYDLFLHTQDRAYLVKEVAKLAGDAGLSVVDFVPRALYDPIAHMPESAPRELLDRVGALGWLEKAALAEVLCSTISMHTVFLVSPAEEAVVEDNIVDITSVVSSSGRLPLGTRFAPRATAGHRAMLPTFLSQDKASDVTILFHAASIRDDILATLRALPLSEPLRIYMGHGHMSIPKKEDQPLSRIGPFYLPRGASELIALMDEKQLNVAEIYPMWRELRVQAKDVVFLDQQLAAELVSWGKFWNVTRSTFGVLEGMHVAFLSWS